MIWISEWRREQNIFWGKLLSPYQQTFRRQQKIVSCMDREIFRQALCSLFFATIDSFFDVFGPQKKKKRT